MRNDRQIARRYARAFVEGRTEPAKIEALAEEAAGFAAAVDRDVHIKDFFLNPLYKKQTKINVLKATVDKLGFSSYTFSLLEILINKDRFNILTTVADELREYADRLNKRVRVNVTTAVEPSPADLKDISDGLREFFKRDTVVHRTIDPSVIGGFVIEGDGKMIDLSVAGQIRRILSRV